MDKKIYIGLGVVIVLVVSIYLYSNLQNTNTNNYNPKMDYDDKTWLDIVVQGDSGEGIKINDKKLHILVGLSSYDPSKIEKCNHAEVIVEGCGVYHKGYTDENGYIEVPVNFTKKGILTITVKYKNYVKTVTVSVE